MLYHTIQKFSDADDKIAKSVGIRFATSGNVFSI